MQKRVLLIFFVVGALGGLAVVGILPKLERLEDLKTDANSAATAVPGVQVVMVGQAKDTLGLTLPGRLDAQRTTEIFARAQGYVTRWTADVGQSVKAGQILATLAQPELDDDIAAAQTQVDLAKANLARLESVTLEGAISGAEVDDAKAKVRTAEAQRARLAQLRGFQQVVAPFAGVVTARNVEVGSYVTPGTTPLFTLNSEAKLRVFVDVPQADIRTSNVQEGEAKVIVPELKQAFVAKIVRNAGAYNPATRTLSIQLEIDKPDGLVPGMFVQVNFPPKARMGQEGLTVPANAIYPSPAGPTVLVVNAQNKIEFRPIGIFKDFGTYVVTSSGITPGEQLVINPNSRLTEGLSVHVLPPDTGHVAGGGH
jgi:RND family efflux transporter MFP subunit